MKLANKFQNNPERILAKVHAEIRGVKFKIGVKRAATGIIEDICEGKNVILDSGLDAWGLARSAEMTYYCAVGTGSTPTQRDSSTTTVSQSGTTATASANYFEAGDVGRLLKYDSGEETYITGFTSTTIVTVADSATISAAESTIWYVDDTVLAAQTTRQNSFRTDSGDNTTTVSAGIITHKRTHLFSAVGGPVTYNEIGWSPNSGAGDLFNRALISGGVSLVLGDQLLVESNLELTQAPQTSVTAPDVGTGLNSVGTIQIEGYGCSEVNSSGGFSTVAYEGLGTPPSQVLEPSTNNLSNVRSIAITSTNPAFAPYGTTTSFSLSVGTTEKRNYAESTYFAGNYYRYKFVTFTTTEGNIAAVKCIILGIMYGGKMESNLRVVMTSTFAKLNTQTLFIVFSQSWSRTLTN